MTIAGGICGILMKENQYVYIADEYNVTSTPELIPGSEMFIDVGPLRTHNRRHTVGYIQR